MSAPVRLDDALDQALLEEAIAHLDFEPTCQVQTIYAMVLFGVEIPVGSRVCGRKAEWIAVCRSCARSAFECGPCHEEAKSASWVRCSSCQSAGAVTEVFVTSRLWS